MVCVGLFCGIYCNDGVFFVVVQVTQSDKGVAMLNALDTAFPQSARLQCWVHLSRKLTEGSFRKYMEYPENLQDYSRYIELIHVSHTTEMATAVANCVLRWLRTDREERLAAHLQQEYLSEPYFKWTLGAILSTVRSVGICGSLWSLWIYLWSLWVLKLKWYLLGSVESVVVCGICGCLWSLWVLKLVWYLLGSVVVCGSLWSLCSLWWSVDISVESVGLKSCVN